MFYLQAAQIFHGLTELQHLAFDLAAANDITNIPKSWTD